MAMKAYLFLGVVLAQFLAFGQTSTERSRCVELDEFAIARVAANQLGQAEAAISAAASRGNSLCAGVVSGNVATLMSAQGHIREAEAFAARSVDLLRKSVAPDHPMLLRPLHALVMARLEQRKLDRAEQGFEQMLHVRAERPEQRGQIHITGGVLLHIQGRLKEAEAKYLLAYEDWKQFGKPGDADEAAILNYLGALYLAQGRFEEAAQVLDRGLAIVAAAGDAYRLDRIELLNARASVYARHGEWREAQEKLHRAIAIADDAGVSEPVVLRSVLKNYAIVLRKNHRRKEARTIESRVSALPRDTVPGTVVIDIRELSKNLKARQH
jgi:tetratricopeptide (TPR) repeat protein